MRRNFIGIEDGEHATSHCAPRLMQVIAGEQGGISEAENWKGGGGFRFYRLGPTLFENDATGRRISDKVRFQHLAAHVWFRETGIPWEGRKRSPLLGVHKGRAIYLLFNGILGDKSANGGNVLTGRLLADLPAHDGPKLVFGEACRLGEARLAREGVEFRQIPYDVAGA